MSILYLTVEDGNVNLTPKHIDISQIITETVLVIKAVQTSIRMSIFQ